MDMTTDNPETVMVWRQPVENLHRTHHRWSCQNWNWRLSISNCTPTWVCIIIRDETEVKKVVFKCLLFYLFCVRAGSATPLPRTCIVIHKQTNRQQLISIVVIIAIITSFINMGWDEKQAYSEYLHYLPKRCTVLMLPPKSKKTNSGSWRFIPSAFM